MTIKEIIRRSYLGKLFYRDKFLFTFITLFFAFSIFASLIRLGTTPFFLWSVYSERMPPEASYEIYEVRYNGRLLNIKHTWEQTRKMFLFDPLAFYSRVVAENEKDLQRDYLENHWSGKHPRYRKLIPLLLPGPVDFSSFPDWYRKYLSQQVDEPIKDIYVIKKKVRFAENGGVEELSSDTIIIMH